VRTELDDWLGAAAIDRGKLFRRVNKVGRTWGDGMTVKAVWHIVKESAKRIGVAKLAPHDLRRTCAGSATLREQGQYPDQCQNAPYQSFSPEQLDNLLSPVALYPDPLLAQLLVAATFPDQVEEAPRDACRSDGGPALRMTALRKSRWLHPLIVSGHPRQFSSPE
jgi:hypothetical protein